MPISEKLLEVRQYAGPGYQPLIDFGAWRVAILRMKDDMLPQNLDKVQKHDETDEVFVLLTGRCILFLGDGDQPPGELYAQEMEPLRVYNVKKGAWHAHTLSSDAVVLIVENCDTTLANSPFSPLNAGQQAGMVQAIHRLWG